MTRKSRKIATQHKKAIEKPGEKIENLSFREWLNRAWSAFLVFFTTRRYKWRMRVYDFLNRRPHRSFRRTRRRDYSRSLKIPGYFSFTHQVNKIIRKNWKIFLPIIIIYSLIMISIGAITSQETYDTIGGLVTGSTNDLFGGGLGKLAQAGLLVISSFGADPTSLNTEQQFYMAVSLIFSWLTTVWLLREILMNRRPRLRDGLYNSGAPILSTILVLIVLLIQLLPIGVMALIFAGLSAIDFMGSGFGRMIVGVLSAMVVAMVLYWISSTIIALVVVTLPGMYPMQALKASGDLIVGRRLRVMYRLVWGMLRVMLTWLVVMIIVVLLERQLSSWWEWFAKIPVVPYVGALMTAWAVVWFASYVYLLYRRVVDDDAKPA